MRIRSVLSALLLFVFSLAIAVGCTRAPNPDLATSPTPARPEARDANAPLVLGYSAWVGWLPWAIAEEAGLFEANGANVELKWYDGYLESMEAMAAGEIDANCQTLSDTISFVGDSDSGQVVVLVNDNSVGNDKVIASAEIETVADLAGKKVAVEEGVVGDFLLTLALEESGLARDDVDIVPLETSAAVEAFVAGQTDAVGVFAPYWTRALEREGAKEIASSAAFPGAIPDLLVVSQTAIDDRSDTVQALIDTWFDVLTFMRENPTRADEIIATRGGITPAELELFKQGTRLFSLPDNLEAFAPGDNMKHLQFAAQKTAKYMVGVDFLQRVPDLETLLDERFVEDYADRIGDRDTSVRDVEATAPAATPSEPLEFSEPVSNVGD